MAELNCAYSLFIENCVFLNFNTVLRMVLKLILLVLNLSWIKKNDNEHKWADWSVYQSIRQYRLYNIYQFLL